MEKYPTTTATNLSWANSDMGYPDDSIQHLQSGVRSPKHRLKSIVYLGRAFKAKGFYDMAASQLETAKTDSPQMDEIKKRSLRISRCYELNGDPEKAIEEFKEIYNADVGYPMLQIKLTHTTQVVVDLQLSSFISKLSN